jgi:hypothetical protein
LITELNLFATSQLQEQFETRFADFQRFFVDWFDQRLRSKPPQFNNPEPTRVEYGCSSSFFLFQWKTAIWLFLPRFPGFSINPAVQRFLRSFELSRRSQATRSLFLTSTTTTSLSVVENQ